MSAPVVRKGERVHIRPEWQDNGDAGIVFVAVEDSDGDRVLVEAQVGLAINPVSVIKLSMLEAQSCAS